jgi:hypothetical protein
LWAFEPSAFMTQSSRSIWEPHPDDALVELIDKKAI